jgi:hypothetical protein
VPPPRRAGAARPVSWTSSRKDGPVQQRTIAMHEELLAEVVESFLYADAIAGETLELEKAVAILKLMLRSLRATRREARPEHRPALLSVGVAAGIVPGQRFLQPRPSRTQGRRPGTASPRRG